MEHSILASLFSAPDSWGEVAAMTIIVSFVIAAAIFALDSFYLRKSKYEDNKKESDRQLSMLTDLIGDAQKGREKLTDTMKDLKTSTKELRSSTEDLSRALNKHTTLITVLYDRAGKAAPGENHPDT